MAEPFIGEIRMVSFNYAPTGWASCDGQIVPIIQNTALFSLVGTTYGGDGTTTFALPDFRARGPIHRGQGNGLSERDMGEVGGSESSQLLSSGAKISQSPTNPVPLLYANPNPPVSTMEPFLVVNFIIALTGGWPNRPEA
jgi:microcystin-dependent protein